MEIAQYCDRMTAELTGWKVKLDGLLAKANELAPDQKSKIMPVMQDLDALVGELDSQIASLAAECPADWQSQKTAIEKSALKIRDGWKSVWGAMGEPEYGVGGA
jgi:uncharacterized protein YoxC